MPDFLTAEEKEILIGIARESIQSAILKEKFAPMDLDNMSVRLRELGVVFVTLTHHNQLRGCIGALEPYQPLAEDVREHAVAAATNDFRFIPIQPEELQDLTIEISCLTIPMPVEYETPSELVELFRLNKEGVVLKDGYRRATFLPQVWEKIHNPAEFLSQLCQKMGAPPDLWMRKHLDVFTYQVEEFRG